MLCITFFEKNPTDRCQTTKNFQLSTKNAVGEHNLLRNKPRRGDIHFSQDAAPSGFIFLLHRLPTATRWATDTAPSGLFHPFNSQLSTLNSQLNSARLSRIVDSGRS
jgi:hypothetical protein